MKIEDELLMLNGPFGVAGDYRKSDLPLVMHEGYEIPEASSKATKKILSILRDVGTIIITVYDGPLEIVMEEIKHIGYCIGSVEIHRLDRRRYLIFDESVMKTGKFMGYNYLC